MAKYMRGNIVKLWMFDILMSHKPEVLKAYVQNKHKLTDEQYEEYKNVYIETISDAKFSSMLLMLNEDYDQKVIDRKALLRHQAYCTLELTKGFTPEQRQSMGNLLTTMEEMAQNVMELTQA